MMATISQLTGNVTSIFNTSAGMVSDVAGAIVDNPLLLVFALIPLVGIGVGLFKRLLNVN